MIVFGNGTGMGTFGPGNHTWVTQVGDISAFDPVLLINQGKVLVALPEPTTRQHRGPGRIRRFPGGGPELIREFSVQILLWSPLTFPNNPEQYSHGLDVRVYSDGTVLGTPYGTRDNMSVWAKGRIIDDASGVDRHVEITFPFEIDGF